MEYMQARKMDHTNADDKKKIREYFSSKDGDASCDGMKVQIASWHK